MRTEAAQRKPFTRILYVSGARDADVSVLSDTDVDAVILDLEDSVPPDLKRIARERIIGWNDRAKIAPLVAVRINEDLPDEDVPVAKSSSVDAVVLPKVSGMKDLKKAVEKGFTRIWVMIESLDALTWLSELGQAPPELEAVVIGYKDLSADMGCAFDPELPQLSALASTILAAARSHNLRCFDGVTIGSAEVVADAAVKSASRGYDGVTLYNANHLAEVQTRLRAAKF